jgi:beta-glucanase (GH16 family)
VSAEFGWQPIIGRPGQTVQFRDLSTRSPTSWAWTFYNDTGGFVVAGTSTEQNPIFSWPIAGHYRVHLAVVESGIPTQPPPVDPPDPPDPTYPPTDPPVLTGENPPTLVLNGRSLSIDHDFTLGSLPAPWVRRSGSGDGVETWDPALVTVDGSGAHVVTHLVSAGVYTAGAMEADFNTGPGLYAFKVTGAPKGPHLLSRLFLHANNGSQQLAMMEDPDLDSSHYYVTARNPNWPTQPVLSDITTTNIYAVDWRPDGVQFYVDWYPVGQHITDAGFLAGLSGAKIVAAVHAAVGGPWAGAPDGSTDAYLASDREIVIEWFRFWPEPLVSGNPSGEAPPSGNLPGWNLEFVEDFNVDSAVGSWGPTEHDVPSAYVGSLGVYEDGWLDTAASNDGSIPSRYMPTQVLSTSGSLLQWHLFNAGSGARSAVVRVGEDMLYGRVAMRFKSEALDGFKTAWLWWPQSGDWPNDGEIDFPEGALDSTIGGFMHHQGAVSGGDQDGADSGVTYTDWHTAVIEWDVGDCRFLLDGVTVLHTTDRVPNTPMHFVLQTESDLGGNQPPVGTSGFMWLDWVALYSKA